METTSWFHGNHEIFISACNSHPKFFNPPKKFVFVYHLSVLSELVVSKSSAAAESHVTQHALLGTRHLGT